jgi:hypothetical protein
VQRHTNKIPEPMSIKNKTLKCESVKSIKGFIEKINAKLKIKVNMYGKEYDVFKYLDT